MGRIDQALRRAGTDGAAKHEPATGADTAASPWSFGDAPAAAPAHEPTPVKLRQATAAPSPMIGHEPESGIAGFSPNWREKLVTTPGADFKLVEQFRRLAAAMYQAQTSGRLKVVMVTSAEPGDGKTLTAVNLALILSESYGRRVLLIDADLRRPTISSISGAGVSCGLTEGLKAKHDTRLSLIRITERLTLLPAGLPDPDPMSALTSSRMRRILDDASASFDWVIVDAPPTAPVADASLLADMVDATLLVVRAGATGYPAAQKAIESIGRDRIFGVVLNAVDKNAVGNDAHYAYYGAAPVAQK